MDIIGALLFIIFIVLPAIAIFSFSSRVTSGVYHWADRQHPQPVHQYSYVVEEQFEEELEPVTIYTEDFAHEKPIKKPIKKPVAAQAYKNKPLKTPLHKEDRELMESYLGYDLAYEDSEEFKKLLDKQSFDVRKYLSNGKRN